MKYAFSYIVFAFLLSSVLLAQTPSTINYQGVARNKDGLLLKNYTIYITFTIYEDNNSTKYQEKKEVITNKFGVFSTQIGPIGNDSENKTIKLSQLEWGNGKEKKIESFYDFGNNNGTLSTVPITLNAVPYSFHSIHADSAKVATKLDGFTNFWTPQKNDIIYSTGNIGIGSTDFIPQARLHIDKGNLQINFGDIALLNGNLGLGTNNAKEKIHLTNGNVYLENSSSGIYFKSSNGSCYLLKVNNIGELQLEVKTCP